MSAPAAETLPRELVEELQKGRRRRIAALGEPMALRWLAVVPEWSKGLAKKTGFPLQGKERTLDEFLTLAAAAGLCQIRRGAADDETTFWMPEHAREVYAGAAEAASHRDLRETATQIASKLGKGPALSPLMQAWTDLASRPSVGSAQHLTLRVVERLDAYDVAGALTWVSAAEPLAAVVRGPLESALARARRRIALQYRDRQDAILLENHVERDGALVALRELIEGPDELWSTHFVGMGGVGKTMLVRYLTVKLADAFPERLLVGRVDFDHLDPRFPWERPAELLVVLADALLVHAGVREESLVEALVEAVRQADEQRAPGVPMQATDPALTPVYDRFGDLLEALQTPDDENRPRRVVLVLDTCEELAKLHAPGEELTSVDRAFEILQAVHERSKRTRVVLAGRRLLAVAGAGWEYDARTARHGAVASSREREYLRLFELRGFDREEAETLLRDKHGDLRDDQIDATLAASREIGRVPGMPLDDPGPERYNPFDVELFARWIKSSREPVDAEAIHAGGRDAYVKARILDRIKEPEVREALPAVVLLGRFDRAMLEPAIEADPSRTMIALAQQEFVDVVGGTGPETWILQVEPQLLERLRAWYAKEEPRAVEPARATLGPALAQLLLEDDLERLGVERVDAVMRCLAVGDTIAFWSSFEPRLASMRAWSVAKAACERLLDPEEYPPSMDDPLLRAQVKAANAAAQLHLGRPRAASAWREVLALVEGDTRPEARTLAARAMVIAAIGEDRSHRKRSPDWWRDALPMLMERRDEQTVATVLAALESMLEGSEGAPGADWPSLEIVDDWGRSVTEGVDRFLGAAVLCARARWAAWSGEIGLAKRRFRDAIDIAPPEPPPQSWSDWIAPGSVADRVRLEALVHDADCGTPTVERVFIGEAMERSRSIDAQCVLSLSLESARVLGMPDPWSLELLRDVAREPPEDAVKCRAHERVPQLFVAVGRSLLARGDVAGALALVEERAERASYKRGSDAGDLEEAAEAGIMTLEIARAARLGRYGPRALREATHVEGRGYAAAVALIALTLPPEDYPHRPPRNHHDQLTWARAWPRPEPPREATSWFTDGRPTTFSIDTAELERLYREAGREGTDDPNALISLFEDLMHRGRSDEPVLEPLHVTLAVRFAADGTFPSAVPPGVVARVLVEEGELLALREPAAAIPMLRSAAEQYAEADDDFGAFRAYAAAALAERRVGREPSLVAVRALYEPLRPSGAVGDEGSLPDAHALWADGWEQRIKWLDRTEGTAQADVPNPPAEMRLSAPAEPVAERKRKPPVAAALVGLVAVVAVAVGVLVDVVTGIGVLALAAVVFLVSRLFEGWVGLAWRFVEVTCVIEAGPDEPAARLRSITRPRWMRETVSDISEMPLEDGRPMRTPSELTKSLASLRRFPQQPDIALEIDDELQIAAWEAALLLSEGPDRIDRLPALWRRVHAVGEDGTETTSTVRKPAITLVVVGGSDQWAILAQDAWRLGRRPVYDLDVMNLFAETGAAIAHVFGAPAFTNSGWHLRADRADAGARTKSVSTAASASQVLVAPETLVLAAHDLVVVQGEPGTRDHTFNEGLRAFGHAVAVAGARAVLVVPGVGPEPAAKAAQGIARAIGSKQVTRRRVLRALRAARTQVGAPDPATGSPDPLELALDVCLFITEDAQRS